MRLFINKISIGRKPAMRGRFFIFFILTVALACAAYALIFRLNIEKNDKNVAIIADYREVLNLARGAGVPVEEALKILIENGVRGIMVSELIGDDAAHGLGYAFLRSSRDGGSGKEGTIISIMPDSPYAEVLNEWLRLRFNISDENNGIKNLPVFLPFPINMFKNIGIIPDIDGLELAKKLNLKIFYRPAQSFGWMADRAALMLEKVCEIYPVGAFAPAGEIVSGYPDVSALANTAHKLNLPLALVEFSRQVGAPALNNKTSPLLIPLHSVTNEEMTARNISRKALRERLIRAAVERSVRFLLLRTPPQNMAEFSLNDYVNEVKLLAAGLEGTQGFKMAWPAPNFTNPSVAYGASSPEKGAEDATRQYLSAWALASVFILSVYLFTARMKISQMPDNFNAFFVLKFFIISLVTAFLIAKFNNLARIAGAFAAPFIVTEASLAAMDFYNNKSFLSRIFNAVFMALTGGLAIAAFFSVPSYMLRLQTFSGVKLTLMLPPLLVLIHDLKKRVHPESLKGILSRPPLWGELALCGVLLAGLGIMLFRSGNVSFIPGFEARIRETLERLLIARPRSKEVFLGYPCLLVLGFLVKNNLWERYREVLRIGVALGFSSVVNSFCHFHTPLLLILLREFNGLWTGLLLGVILTLCVKFILIPALKILRPLFI